MQPMEIKKGVYWVGAVDWGLRNFHGYSTERGSTYNAYLIVDEKIALVDTVKHYLFPEMLERIRSIVDPSRIDVIISNHVEMDHSGSLPKILKICPKAQIITSVNGEKGLKKHYDTTGWNIRAVNSGDQISLGGHTPTFVHTQMVHWPDSMVTYIPEKELLLSNDAFGQHVASTQKFEDELGWDIAKEEAAKYYANIVLPYGQQVNKALDVLSTLKIDMIAPSHGIIWRSNIKELLALYRKWANNATTRRSVVVYDSMWGSTAAMAGAIVEAFDLKGIPAKPMDLKTVHISDVMAEVLEAEFICVGSPTLNNGMLPTVAGFLSYMKGLAPKNRRGLAFGSYGWGGQSLGLIEEQLKSCGMNTFESVKHQYVPDTAALAVMTERVKEMLDD